MCTKKNTDIYVVLRELQNRVGRLPQIHVATFKNWAGTQVRSEILAVTPTTVQEVQAVVRAARTRRLRVRAVGIGHSWTPLFSDEGHVVMYMKDLGRPDGNKQRTEVVADPDDPHCKLVTVATGVTTGELKELQLRNGVCIPSNVILTIVQMGGVVAPACHGIGWNTKSVSDYLVRMRIVDSSGNLRTYSMKDDPDMMRAVQCSLGLWGIIVDMTFKTEPMIMVETTNIWLKVRDIFYNKENLQKLLNEHWSIQMFYFPFNGMSAWESVEAGLTGEVDLDEWEPKDDEVWVRLVDKVDIVGPAEGQLFYDWGDLTAFLQAKGSLVADKLITSSPRWAPLFLKTQIPIIKESYKHNGTLTQELPNAVHFRSNLQDLPVQDMAWCFNVDEDCSNVCTAVQGVLDMVRERAVRGQFPLNLPLEIRFLGHSKAYMAPYSTADPQYGGTDRACVVEVITMAGTPGWKEFAQQVATLWQTLSGARTHWCKEWSYIKDIDQFIRKSYADTMPKYLSALERSGADPTGMFFNDRLQRIFYPGGHPSSTGATVTPLQGGSLSKL